MTFWGSNGIQSNVWTPSKPVKQDGFAKHNFNFGSSFNDSFTQTGFFNTNTAFGNAGRDSFNMGGFFNHNNTYGGTGSDFFEMGGNYNTNTAQGGSGNDTFIVEQGKNNTNYINGGEGFDSVMLKGNKSDYISYKDDKGSHYYNKDNNSWTHLQDVENVFFSNFNVRGMSTVKNS
ncbi:MAG: hypothetical protein AB7V50_09550 [Vampirovibrionia bacterium]